MFINAAAFEEDGYVCNWQNPDTLAQAKIMCAERTSGMMMGNRYRILTQTPTDGGANAEYISLGRGDSAISRGVEWLQAHGFVAWKKPQPNFVGKRGQGIKLYGEGKEAVEGTITGYHMQHVDAWNKRMCPWISKGPGFSSPVIPESLEIIGD